MSDECTARTGSMSARIEDVVGVAVVLILLMMLSSGGKGIAEREGGMVERT